MSPHQHLHAVDVKLRGNVQGVGLRYRIMWSADEEGVSGWVRNEEDGTVSVHLEGAEHRVENVLAILRAGYSGVTISRMETARSEVEGVRGFQIIH